MSVSAAKIGRALAGLLGFVALSAVAALVLTIGLMPAVAVTASAADAGISTFNGLPEYLKIPKLDQTTTFYATKGGKPVPIATFYAQNRIDVSWSGVSQYAKDAAVATEDPRFYEEGGIDVLGTVRAAISTATNADLQGGSSITQQYVKNVLVQRCNRYAVDVNASKDVQEAQRKKWSECNYEASGVTIPRKLREMRYAIGLQKKYSKNEILLGYLNIAGFGGRVYGIEAAAKYYFSTTAANLTLAQAATLVAILNNPANLRIDQDAKTNKGNNADNGYAATLTRRDYVLRRMLANQKITQSQYDDAVKTKIEPKITQTTSGCMSATQYDAGFFCNYVQHLLVNDKVFGKTATQREQAFQLGGLQVYTTLNLDVQAVAKSSLSAYVPPTRDGMDLGGTNVSMKVGTGEIVSMVENRDYNDSANAPAGTTSVNYATDHDQGGSAGFQTGSSFKAFDLAAWLEAGHTLYESVNANVHKFPASSFHASCTGGWGDWPVANDESSEGGYLSVMEATTWSVNTAFAMMATKLDLCSISDVAKRLLVHSASPTANPWQIVPSMILGTNYISPLTMATAYAGIANKGVVCTPIAITKLVGRDGEEKPVPKTTCTRAMPENIAAAVSYALQNVMKSGTAMAANPRDGVPIMSKTGTTDYAYDNWLVTSTTSIATATWIGNVQGVPDANGIYRKADMHRVYFRANGTGPAIAGNNIKFYVAKPILQALNATYPGGALPTPPNSLLYPYRPPTPTTPPSPGGGGGGNGGGSGGSGGGNGGGSGGGPGGGTGGPGGGNGGGPGNGGPGGGNGGGGGH
ncbi:transglycosylase domain-containing protein [Microbacterium sp. STN6]|uniref:transglycosylase domain-containing protein n=1 Tax=Microbacterium sp. STN6 TaxID=2995588 RepID=UPI00226083DD|nr:transglycosylase domain-containing protein [Microbacterium sp. STN6]MCX7520918.1 transglycosylase domain-containing protein [Microbacterium sp. STN6]